MDAVKGDRQARGNPHEFETVTTASSNDADTQRELAELHSALARHRLLIDGSTANSTVLK